MSAWATAQGVPLPNGTAVMVREAYRGSGRYEADEFTGPGWYIVGNLGLHGGAFDYKLARHPGDPWAVIVHASRVSPA